ncbi:hypothetical protein QBC34DRAFT_36699 [Podospora aff. communis PSN243]|uniref:Secreted protein n=1 Tax=Podospora aff. communis PSN243 TaxID=3040156 RepID=A0AAV9GVZ3_9PEZI|nr:hypothetical protein QBC34DRAFT_36699 [Podospora aff. communis PSN243]
MRFFPLILRWLWNLLNLVFHLGHSRQGGYLRFFFLLLCLLHFNGKATGDMGRGRSVSLVGEVMTEEGVVGVQQSMASEGAYISSLFTELLDAEFSSHFPLLCRTSLSTLEGIGPALS